MDAVPTREAYSLYAAPRRKGSNATYGPFSGARWWTRSQKIRTFGEIPFEVALLETGERPVYQRIAVEVVQLARLGMRKAAIARSLGVDAKTVKKAIDQAGRPG